MQILITGGAGFIGSHLANWLATQGHHIRVFDNLSHGDLNRLLNQQSMIEFIQGDVRDLAHIQAVAEGVEFVFHMAAIVSVERSIALPLDVEAVNALGTLHVLEAARQNGVRRVVLASSCAVYGDTDRLPSDEQALPDPLSPYAASKLTSESMGRLYARLYEADAVALRLFNVYGPGQDSDSLYSAAIPRFISAFRASEQPVIYGDGEQTRDFVYIDDAVRALWSAAVTPAAGGGVFNVGSGEAHTIRSVAQHIAELFGVPFAPRYAPYRPGEARHSWANPQRFRDYTGFRTTISLRNGLARTMAEQAVLG